MLLCRLREFLREWESEVGQLLRQAAGRLLLQAWHRDRTQL
jgi:hypothetical protein